MIHKTIGMFIVMFGMQDIPPAPELDMTSSTDVTPRIYTVSSYGSCGEYGFNVVEHRARSASTQRMITTVVDVQLQYRNQIVSGVEEHLDEIIEDAVVLGFYPECNENGAFGLTFLRGLQSDRRISFDTIFVFKGEYARKRSEQVTSDRDLLGRLP